MRGVFRAGLVVVCLVLILFSFVSGYTVSPITVEPKGSLVPGTPVNITFTISNPESDSNDFPEAADLEMSSELETPTWSIAILSDGMLKPQPIQQCRLVSLSDWELPAFNRNIVHEQIKVTLFGYAPEVDRTMNKTVIRISQLDSKNNPIGKSVTTVSPMIVNTCCIRSPIPAKKADLQTFRFHIDEKTAMGVNTTDAEEKYTEAKVKIDAASVMPSTQYATAFRNLNNATEDISDGERLLDKAWAEKTLADTDERINQIDSIIAWCKGNGTTASLPELRPIIIKREIAVSYISTAKDAIFDGNFSAAQVTAQKAYAQANATYNEADTLYQILNRPVPCVECKVYSLLLQVITAGFIVSILSITGYFWWKKRESGGTV